MSSECYCCVCSEIKCPREQWGGECDCDYGPCPSCEIDLGEYEE